MTILSLLGVNALVLAGTFVLLWAICLKTRDVTPVDSFWAFGMVLMAGTSFAQTGGDPTRKRVLLGVCMVWGLRLGGYMLWRWRDQGPDRRYQTLLAKAEASKGWAISVDSRRNRM